MACVVIICILLAAFLFIYPLLMAGKRADEKLRLICERDLQCNVENEETEERKNEMESQRDCLRSIEREIKKGSAPLYFDSLGFTEESYHLVESQAKLNELLDYLFRNGEFAAFADKQIKSNVYLDCTGKKIAFRQARSEMDRRNMEVSAKRWIKKKHPTFDGDVYVENARCFLEFPAEEQELRTCKVNEKEVTVFIFSRKHLEALYLQCLISRREAMQQLPQLEGFSETCNRIYRLEDVDVLFQCLLLDQLTWEEGRLYGQFTTVYMLKNK